jgi:muramoyltetrapeptide carboxypeptidase
MITPLSSGDSVCLVAPGRKDSAVDVNEAMAVFKQWGLQVEAGKNLFSNQHSYLAGTDQERITDFQTALNDPAIKAIICARGGYGCSRIIDQLDFTRFQDNPKWIVGFSDITCFHLACASMELPSIHGAMPIQFSKSVAAESVESLRKILFEGQTKFEGTPNNKNCIGNVDAPLIGGNLSLLVDSLGTKYELETAGKILMIEEIDEPRYKVDRMLMQLKRAGKLDQIAGLGIGQMTEIGDSSLPFDETIEQIVLSKIEPGIPVAFNLPFGHEHPNYAWVQGNVANFVVNESKVILTQDAVRH